jgi:hypothetical protein
MTTRLDLTIPESAMYQFVVTVVGGPSSLTDYIGHMQLKQTKVDQVATLDLGAADIEVNDSTRQVIVTVNDDLTVDFPWENGVYDLYIIGPGDDRWRLVEGSVTIDSTVTSEV